MIIGGVCGGSSSSRVVVGLTFLAGVDLVMSVGTSFGILVGEGVCGE